MIFGDENTEDTVTNDRIFSPGDGYVALAPYGSPVDNISPLGPMWVDLGICAADGGPSEERSVTTDTVRAWPSGRVVKRSVTEGSLTVTVTPIETNATAVELFNGAPLDVTGHVVVVVGDDGGVFAMVTDIWDGTQFVRSHYAKCEVTGHGSQQVAAGGHLSYPVTISAEPDPSLRGRKGRMGTVERWYVPLANPGPLPEIPNFNRPPANPDPETPEEVLAEAAQVEVEAIETAGQVAEVIDDIATQYPTHSHVRVFPVPEPMSN